MLSGIWGLNQPGPNNIIAHCITEEDADAKKGGNFSSWMRTEWMRGSGIQCISQGAHFALLPVKEKTRRKSKNAKVVKLSEQ